ncbi:MAG: hypothetical protein JSS72_09350 [Armatimonadetes bacterium]|nr:hypothetical protein [Armatimonadota bacterium]
MFPILFCSWRLSGKPVGQALFIAGCQAAGVMFYYCITGITPRRRDATSEAKTDEKATTDATIQDDSQTPWYSRWSSLVIAWSLIFVNLFYVLTASPISYLALAIIALLAMLVKSDGFVEKGFNFAHLVLAAGTFSISVEIAGVKSLHILAMTAPLLVLLKQLSVDGGADGKPVSGSLEGA